MPPKPGQSLAEKRPKLAKEWHPAKNGKLTPWDVCCKSGKAVWWQCNKGHEWEAEPGRRGKHSKCPYCRGRRVCNDNCLSYLSPAVAQQWHPTKNGKLTPDMVTCNSQKMAWWQCPICKNVWRARIDSRQTSGCPKCCHLVKNNDQYKRKKTSLLGIKCPHLIKEWDYAKNGAITPFNITYGSTRMLYWKCANNNNHMWQATAVDRCIGKINCPYCGNRIIDNSNCLATLDPELAKEWHPTKNKNLTPAMANPKSIHKVWWKCSRCGREWQAGIRSRFQGHGCLCGSGKIKLQDGTYCDSLVESLFYLLFKSLNVTFLHDEFYNRQWGRCRYDFYFPLTNTYMEVSSIHPRSRNYRLYFKTINKKQHFVKKHLKSKFIFLNYVPTKIEYRYVRNNMVKQKYRRYNEAFYSRISK